ncbi:MAG: indole-3-glycerol phosphate synthase TrpC [Endomicrobiaceae bacterium]|jgi:indole-3-glycerol phosphate synthase|nr:indole-3-glycerol phosphate synthase TrpC [Endomicrobiaceae bacterium]
MILDKIVAKTKIRISNLKNEKSLDEIKTEAEAMPLNLNFPFECALKTKDISFICEVKKASPSKGLIARDFPYLSIALEYEAAGASAISVLTEPDFFLGDNKYLSDIAKSVKIPVLRKDFIIDPYQIYEAKCIGASAILLICSLLDTKTISEYISTAENLGLSALVEAHNKEEVESAVKAGAKIIGINNRNLKTFEVNINNSINLREFVPENVLFVSESGIKTCSDIKKLREINADAVLIGETLMCSKDKKKALQELRGAF